MLRLDCVCFLGTLGLEGAQNIIDARGAAHLTAGGRRLDWLIKGRRGHIEGHPGILGLRA
jgi:hypothetical protein